MQDRAGGLNTSTIMKIVISAEGPDLTAQVAHRFGTSPYLIIVDTQTMAFEAISNPSAGSQGGAGVMAVVLSISKEVDAVLTGYCSPTATRCLSENGIEVLTAIRATAADAAEQYIKRKLYDTGDALRKVKSRKTQVVRSALVQALKNSTRQLVNLVPIFMAVILSIGLFTTFISEEVLSSILIAAVYGAVFILAPDKAIEALGRSGKIFLSIAVPIALEKKSFKSRSGSSAMIM